MMVCPDCRGALTEAALTLTCAGCGTVWPPERGFPKLFRERRIRPMDRFMRLFYNGLPALHDPLTTHVLPRLQRDGSERAFRSAVLDAMELETLGGDGPIRVLEVGVGAGANLPLLAERLAGRPAEVWGLDLAKGMLGQCRRRLPIPGLDVHLVLGDAHRLPFADHSFDRVFHVGAVATWGDPSGALAEMARVARPGSPIVVVDEQLDRGRRNTLRDRLAFRLLTFYDRDPHVPFEHVPPGATDVRAVQVSRFLYCLSFRVPPSRNF